jgi:putative transposase
MKYRFISSYKNTFAVRTMCRVLQVSVSGYYGWTQRPESNRSKQNREIRAAIKKIHKENHEVYGSPRIANSLKDEGYRCSRPRTARLMRFMNIRAKTVKKFKVTTDSNHNEPVAPNLLDQNFSAAIPNEVWTSDITYVRTGSGWQYLTIILDLFNREIIGRSISSTLSTQTTVSAALEMAVMHRQPSRGVQYASKAFREKLDNYGMIQSMSGKGNCYDNAVTESFFKTLKTEWVYGRWFRNQEDTRHSLFEYIELFYNRKRKHSTLGYRSPIAFLQQYQKSIGMAS